jgi:nitrogen fixation NifU-like protein|tara:strand:+ start:1052 stop:1504 length:453 start_codon:yes stop_codon:yes gene_type:complete
MSEDLTQLYQEIILDHHKRPRNYVRLEAPTHQAEGRNPLCGDSIEVFLRVEDESITEVAFQGQGCAISQASASILTEAVKGKSVENALTTIGQALELFEADGRHPDLDTDGDLAALSGVRKFPARIKCATLSWRALESALEGVSSVSTEG